ncbi:hypothetical protein [Vulcanisaeta distributa]|uniref:hypothetical protein n=1 Tax=Vulcanisaeta distributa TaxID=164451 RepID=UPI000AD560C8|nr:hypothetical protein [Vulcanisaeta distributa]
MPRYLGNWGFEPSIESATLLIGGILSDSGRLSRARPETFEVLAWLLKLAGRIIEI